MKSINIEKYYVVRPKSLPFWKMKMSYFLNLQFTLSNIVLPPLFEENKTFQKSSPFVPFFGHSGCISPWLKTDLLFFPLGSFPLCFFRTDSLFFTIRCLWDGYFCVPCVVHSQYTPIHFHHLRLMTMLIISISALRLTCTSSFVTYCGYLNYTYIMYI